MECWYVQNGDKWIFCYKPDKEEQEKIDSIMPDVIKAYLNDLSEIYTPCAEKRLNNLDNFEEE